MLNLKNILFNNKMAVIFANFVVSLLVAYIPIAIDDYKAYQNTVGLDFTYKSYEDYGLIYLRRFYKYTNIPSDQLGVNYRSWIDEQLKLKNYSLPSVTNKFEVKIPIMFADSIISNTHSFIADVIEKPYCIELKISNRSKKSKYISEIKIKTNMAYSAPLYTTDNCDPDNTKYSVISSKDSGPGFMIKPEDELKLSPDGYLKIFLFFKEKISIVENRSVVVNNNSEGNRDNAPDVGLKRSNENEQIYYSANKIFIKYLLYVSIIFLSLLGFISLLKTILRASKKA